jgi:hypothetical protein
MSHELHNSHKFYLVLKGEIAIFADLENDGLKLLAPVLDEHDYAAGPWLGEAEIPKGATLQLKNVQGGRKVPRDCPHFLVNLPNTKARPELAYFVIDVPFPHDILPGAKQTTTGMSITVTNPDGSKTPVPMPEHTCLAAILVYNWNGVDSPYLADTRYPRRQWPSGGKLPLYRSLHVVAAGDTKDSEADHQHAKTAFHEAARLLGVNAEIDFGGGGEISPTNPPPGLSPLEINLSHFETLELGQALGEILQGGAGRIPTLSSVLFLGGNCGPIGG